MRYRIGVLNDFKNSHTVIDYQEFGVLKVWDAWNTSGEHRGYQVAEDNIYVFLNFKQVMKTKSYEEANGMINRLLREAPVDLSELEFYMRMY